MEPIFFLIAFPVIVAMLLFSVRGERMRTAIVWASALIIGTASVVLVASNIGSGWTPLAFQSHTLDLACSVIGMGIAIVIIWFAVRYRNPLAGILAVVQAAGSLLFEFVLASDIEVEIGFYYDSLTLLMVFIIGVIGSGICIYALGYMKDFQKHQPEDAKDRRPLFFALMFLFLGAMYLIVFSNNLIWLFCGWEVTTVCSFLLIGYTRTEEAIRNAFRQIIMNLLGGIGFLAALYACAIQCHTLGLQQFIDFGLQNPLLANFAVFALAFAGLTKAAQMPFHTWLLGAMVAPTPTSALLHSSTMVKAGVFLLVKLAPLFAVCTVPALMTTLVGGVTFLVCSCLAISQTNAKRVLAYSTVANLGLICICAALGTAEAVWAAMLLILFHAAAKSLLFLCVGTTEHHIGSRDIEDMDLLFQRMPRLARYMLTGIMIMFIAPFGMLLAKWAALVSIADSGNIVLMLLLAFGSAATFMFWAKWMGKLCAIAANPENVETTVHGSEWFATTLMLSLAIICCIALPAISEFVAEPYLLSVFGISMQTLSDDNLLICGICAAFISIVLLGGVRRKTDYAQGHVYLSGVTADSDERIYRDALSNTAVATSRNMYLPSLFGEPRLNPIGTWICISLQVVGLLYCSGSFISIV